MKKNERQKMLAGELYDSGDTELTRMRIQARAWMQEYNLTVYDKYRREKLLQKMLGKIGSNIDIQTPFFIDYGRHIEVGDNFFANFNCVFLDCNYIKIGNNVSIGANAVVNKSFDEDNIVLAGIPAKIVKRQIAE